LSDGVNRNRVEILPMEMFPWSYGVPMSSFRGAISYFAWDFGFMADLFQNNPRYRKFDWT
jgi:hypothetical protein